MDSTDGAPKEVLTELLHRIETPIVTLPARDVARPFVHALGEVEGEKEQVDVILAEGVVSELGWPTRTRAAEYVADGWLSIREGPAADVMVVGPETLGTLDASVRPALGFFGETEEYDRYHERWERSDPVDLDTCGRGELLETTAEIVSEDAAQTVAVETRRDSRGRLDPISLLVWAGAEANVRGSAVADAIEELGLATRRTANRRIESLREEGLVVTETIPEKTRGRPARRLGLGVDVATDEPVPKRIRAALTE
jgi:hypothetical protein